MRIEYLLALLGAALGSMALLCALWIGRASGMLSFFSADAVFPAGAAFESVEDLRRVIAERDERDNRDGGDVSLRSILIPNPADLIIFELKPGLNIKFQSVPLRTNSFGLRGPEVEVRKPAGVYRIALLGDSFAFGWGVEEHNSFARVVERELNRMLAGSKRVELMNFAVPGYSTFQEVALFEEKGLKFDPDAVLVYVIENDFGLPFFIKNLQGEEGLVPAAEFHKVKADELSAEQQTKRSAILYALEANRALVRLSQVAKQEGMRMFVSINPNQHYKRVKDRLWALRSKRREQAAINFIPLRREYLARLEQKIVPEESLRLVGDPHPGPGGHQIVGTLLAERLFPFVQK